MITKSSVYECLKSIIDPELHINIVDLGLIYDVSVIEAQVPETEKTSGKRTKVHILMTLTTPGCPLAGTFQQMVKDSLRGLEIDPNRDVFVELTFDPPWVIDMMDPEARAGLGM